MTVASGPRWLVGILLIAAISSPVMAQEPEGSSAAAPRVVASTERVRVVGTENGVRLAVLDKTIAVDLDDVALGVALQRIAETAGLKLNYRESQVAKAHHVSLHATSITVELALLAVLHGTNLDAMLWPSGYLVLVRHGERAAELNQPQGGAIISGSVQDSATGTPIAQALVRVDGTTLEGKSGADGRYHINGVAPGEYRVLVRRVGYIAKTHSVTLADGETQTVNFALSRPATQLNEVVTTALGEQRRYTVGNVISTINVDSIAPTAPVTSVTDLISARAPGVEVLENSGLVGSGEAIRIRGISSLVLQSDPIVIVDGVREDNSPGGLMSNSPEGLYHATPSRLNDLNFDDIATIDVLKGPAATTEYGTDAANGVIVITTKHGSSGSPLWHADGEQTTTRLPQPFPREYYSWGHITDGSAGSEDCALASVVRQGAQTSTNGGCVVDSITQFNPLNDPTTTLFGTGNRQKYDLSVSGGSDAVRYFFSGGMSAEVGIMRMPSLFKSIADTAGVFVPPDAFKSNSEQERSVRLNSAIRLSSNADLSVNVGYLSTVVKTPDAEFLLVGAEDTPAIDNAANFYGYGPYGFSPLSELSQIGADNSARMTGGATVNWRPAGWLVGHATVGLDHGSDQQRAIGYPIAPAGYSGQNYNSFGSLTVGSTTTDIYTLDVRAAATATLTHGVQAVTSAGLQMADTKGAGQQGVVYNITLSNLTLDGYPSGYNSEATNNAATLGGYAEEQVSLSDRLFLIGALRVDGASGFGSAYSVAAYPKASFSWLVMTGGQTTIRLRGAVGEAGVPPENGASLLLYRASSGYDNGAGVPDVSINWPGNSHLRPERSEEYEAGADIGGWGNRVSLEITGYNKVTHDALVNTTLGGDVCCYTYQENIGEIANSGVEASATIGLIQSRRVTWDVTVNGSVNHNKLVVLAPGAIVAGNDGSGNQNRVGYPLYGFWGFPQLFADANRDGIIEANEVSVGDSLRYLGPGSPTREASVSMYLGLWHNTISIGGLADYRGGYRINNNVAPGLDYVGASPQVNFPTSPLWLQARAVEPFAAQCCSSAGSFFEDGSFIRWRELSVTYAIPRNVARGLRVVDNLSVTAAVRNLALWTRYTGVDPEVSDVSNQGIFTPYNQSPTGASTVNNDIRADGGAVPLLRDWVIRLNMGLK